MSPLSFLVSLATSLPILFIKNQLSWLCWCCLLFLYSPTSLIYTLIYYFLLNIYFGSFALTFPVSSGKSLGYWFEIFFKIWAFIAINFLSTVVGVSHYFWHIVSSFLLISKYSNTFCGFGDCLFDPLLIQKFVVLFPHICEFPTFLFVTNFKFHSM